MKRLHCLCTVMTACLLIAASSFVYAQTSAEHPAPDVDGIVWMKSTELEKQSFLFGAGSAIVLEYYVRDKHSEAPSKFVKGWVDGLKGMSWAELSNRLDIYYKNNPDKMQRHVFEVIWHEVIKPNLKD